MGDLNTALAEFVNANPPDGVLPSRLYHYTIIDAVESLLGDDEDLYATHCSFCDGQDEISPGITAMLNRLVERKLFSEAQRMEMEEFINAKILREHPTFAEENAMIPYVTCFSYDPDSTFNWENRAKNGSDCAIHFDYGALNFCTNKIKEKFKQHPESFDSVLLMPCYYLEDPKINQLLDVFINADLADFSNFSFESVTLTGVVSSLVLASIMIKANDFKPEREWRLVRWLSDERLHGHMKMRKYGGQVLQMNNKQLDHRHIYAGFREIVSPFRNLIRGITISPSRTELMEKVKSMLDDHHITYKQISPRELQRPEIKYRLNLTSYSTTEIS